MAAGPGLPGLQRVAPLALFHLGQAHPEVCATKEEVRMLRKKLNLCEHHWGFWGKIAVGGLVGDAYICTKCPTTEILVHFGSQDEMEKALEDGYQKLEERAPELKGE